MLDLNIAAERGQLETYRVIWLRILLAPITSCEEQDLMLAQGSSPRSGSNDLPSNHTALIEIVALQACDTPLADVIAKLTSKRPGSAEMATVAVRYVREQPRECQDQRRHASEGATR